jgi:uncharacterized protein YndB with AHSA1/START domain
VIPQASASSVNVERVIAASREAVFDAWLDPERLARFMMPGEGMRVARVEVDPREGGSFLIVMVAGAQEMPHRGTYLRIRPHDRLVFSWLSESAGAGSVVTLNFEPLGPRETRITLVHEGLPDADVRDQHREGWTAIFDKLAGMAHGDWNEPSA